MGILDIFGLGGGGNVAPTNGTPGTPTANPVGGFLSKLGLDDPDKRSRLGQSLIALGGSMMKAGGPSYTPNNFLGALGDGMQSFAKTYAGGQDDALKRAYLQAQIGNLGANTKLHTIQAAQAELQAKARADYNGTPNSAGTTAGPIIAPTAGAPGAPGVPSPVPVAPGTVAGPGPAPVAPGQAPGRPVSPGPAPVQAPGAPMDIRPPVARTASAPGPVIGPQGPVPASAAPNAPAPGPVPALAAPATTQDPGQILVARLKELNGLAAGARRAGYDADASRYAEQALALEKHLSSNGMILRPDGTVATVPGYAAGKGQAAQAESAGRSAGELPSKLTLQNNESELRMKEQAQKDQSGDKKTFDDRAKDMNATWNANEYNKKFLAATNIRAGFDRAYEDKSGLATAQLVLNWYKLNDPGSVVSQNEMQTLSTKTQSLGEGLASAVNQALGGNGMSDANKMKLLKNMDGLYQDQRKTYEKQRDNQRTLAGKIGGVDPTMVIPDLTELHSPWKSPVERAAEQAAASAAGRNPALGGGGSTSAPRPPEALGGGGGSTSAPRPPEALGGGGGSAGLPTFAPNDPRILDLPKGEKFKGTDGRTYTKN